MKDGGIKVMGKNTGGFDVCKNCADAFLRVAKDLSPENDMGGFLDGMMYPFAVNCALASELYIKAIMLHESKDNTFETGHKLDDLFSKLPQDVQNDIEEIYNSKEKNKGLHELLAKDGDAFVEWRYALEKPVEMCVSGLLAFAESLREYLVSSS